MPSPRDDLSPPRAGSVLIVDQCRPVAQVLATALEEQFALITLAGSLEEVRQVVADGNGEGFDMVICDHTLPDATSQEVRRWLDERAPAGGRRTPFILMAGSLPGFRRGPGTADSVLLPKPFTFEDLQGALAEARELAAGGEGTG